MCEKKFVFFPEVISVPPRHELMRSAFWDFARTPDEDLKSWVNKPPSLLSALIRRRLPPGVLDTKNAHKKLSYKIPANGWPAEEPWGVAPAQEGSLAHDDLLLSSDKPAAVTDPPSKTYYFWLFTELCQKHTDAFCEYLDRYGDCCYVVNKEGQKLFRSRYPDYPWGRLNQDGTPVGLSPQKRQWLLKKVGEGMTMGAAVSLQQEIETFGSDYRGLG